VVNNNHLVRREDLLEKVWGRDNVEEGNIHTHISNLRKLLGDDEARPTYIETIRGRGFRFIAPVQKSSHANLVVSSLNANNPYRFVVEAHRFVPVYIGTRFNEGVERSTKWGSFRELIFKDSRLCVSEYGIGVWQIRDTLELNSLTDLAIWRRDGFHSILSGTHWISRQTAKLLQISRTPNGDFLGRMAGQLEYVLSVFVLKAHQWSAAELKSALKLCSCPRVLLNNDEAGLDRMVSISREQEFLRNGFEHPDLREFGVFGADLGYAGWAGVSYFGFGKEEEGLATALADFEIALQGLWLFCHLTRKAADQGGQFDPRAGTSTAATIRHQLGVIKMIGPTEPTEQRMMCEAVFASSRVENHAMATLEAIGKKQR
jgi:hypothetical protein